MMRADSPMYLSTMAEDTTLRKLASMLHAMARASSVLPVPAADVRRVCASGGARQAWLPAAAGPDAQLAVPRRKALRCGVATLECPQGV